MTLAPAVAAIREMQRLDLVNRSREMGKYMGGKAARAQAQASLHRRSARVEIFLGTRDGERPG